MHLPQWSNGLSTGTNTESFEIFKKQNLKKKKKKSLKQPALPSLSVLHLKLYYKKAKQSH